VSQKGFALFLMPFTNEDRHMAVFTYIGASYWGGKKKEINQNITEFSFRGKLTGYEERFYKRHLSQQNLLFHGAVE